MTRIGHEMTPHKSYYIAIIFLSCDYKCLRNIMMLHNEKNVKAMNNI